MTVMFDDKGNATISSVAFIRKEEYKINSSSDSEDLRAARLFSFYTTYNLVPGTLQQDRSHWVTKAEDTPASTSDYKSSGGNVLHTIIALVVLFLLSAGYSFFNKSEKPSVVNDRNFKLHPVCRYGRPCTPQEKQQENIAEGMTVMCMRDRPCTPQDKEREIVNSKGKTEICKYGWACTPQEKLLESK